MHTPTAYQLRTQLSRTWSRQADAYLADDPESEVDAIWFPPYRLMGEDPLALLHCEAVHPDTRRVRVKALRPGKKVPEHLWLSLDHIIPLTCSSLPPLSFATVASGEPFFDVVGESEAYRIRCLAQVPAHLPVSPLQVATHMAHRGLHLPEGDVLIHAGDATSTGTPDEVDRFLGWFASQPHPHKILISGNHDWLYQRDPDRAALLLEKHQGITYLLDSGVEIDGVKFWGSPWQPWFMSWAFNLPRGGESLRHVWNLIPIDTEVLVTHGPPHGVLDQVHGGEHLGCEELKIRLASVKPRLHVFGHIHDAFGVAKSRTTTYINACSCTEAYQASNRPIVVDLHPKTIKAHGIEPSKRRRSLDAVKAILDRPAEAKVEETLVKLSNRQLEALTGMAGIREQTADDLLQQYVERGLQADLARVQRAENKPSQRLVPFTRLDE